ncbi:DUF397 domain-containing protein [Sphaerisporangium perillae]|uniref:DUF397 domain-containing protein n=1 Tax=Sphaerisporangium perillae TaxID=2935860 RepID=UPI00200FB65B|nr:DUF397 domain-containing protein [Sphaerisporangium perillae]
MDEMTLVLEAATWRKSSRSGPDGGECVEVAHLAGGRRGVRDSKNPAGPVLVFARSGWDTFVKSVKDGVIT